MKWIVINNSYISKNQDRVRRSFISHGYATDLYVYVINYLNT